MEGWSNKVLSKAQKATLIKPMVQATPTYTMTTFEVPSEVCKEHDSLVRKFWWGSKPESKDYLALKARKDICKPKALGGLGFRLFKDINMNLLAKLPWKLASRPGLLVD